MLCVCDSTSISDCLRWDRGAHQPARRNGRVPGPTPRRELCTALARLPGGTRRTGSWLMFSLCSGLWSPLSYSCLALRLASCRPPRRQCGDSSGNSRSRRCTCSRPCQAPRARTALQQRPTTPTSTSTWIPRSRWATVHVVVVPTELRVLVMSPSDTAPGPYNDSKLLLHSSSALIATAFVFCFVLFLINIYSTWFFLNVRLFILHTVCTEYTY